MCRDQIPIRETECLKGDESDDDADRAGLHNSFGRSIRATHLRIDTFKGPFKFHHPVKLLTDAEYDRIYLEKSPEHDIRKVGEFRVSKVTGNIPKHLGVIFAFCSPPSHLS